MPFSNIFFMNIKLHYVSNFLVLIFANTYKKEKLSNINVRLL